MKSIAQSSVVKHRHWVAQQLSRTFSPYTTDILYPVSTSHRPSPAPGNHHSASCFYASDYFRFLM